jgi:hypothetical protein
MSKIQSAGRLSGAVENDWLIGAGDDSKAFLEPTGIRHVDADHSTAA